MITKEQSLVKEIINGSLQDQTWSCRGECKLLQVLHVTHCRCLAKHIPFFSEEHSCCYYHFLCHYQYHLYPIPCFYMCWFSEASWDFLQGAPKCSFTVFLVTCLDLVCTCASWLPPAYLVSDLVSEQFLRLTTLEIWSILVSIQALILSWKVPDLIALSPKWMSSWQLLCCSAVPE